MKLQNDKIQSWRETYIYGKRSSWDMIGKSCGTAMWHERVLEFRLDVYVMEESFVPLLP